MKTSKIIAILCSFVLMAVAFSAIVKADTLDKKTVITFSEPFEVPGVEAQVLPAGTYVFKVLESFGDLNVVQIFNADETHIFSTILAINNYRLKPTDKTVLSFRERGEGQPEAIKAWFYPGNNFGEEFVYPKKRATELAKLENEPVVANPVETNAVPTDESLKNTHIETVQPTGESTALNSAVNTPPQAAAVAPAKPMAAPATAPAQPTEVAQALPHTASSLPLVGLIGLLSMFAGITLVIITKRLA
jgi:hypothetical protein